MSQDLNDGSAFREWPASTDVGALSGNRLRGEAYSSKQGWANSIHSGSG